MDLHATVPGWPANMTLQKVTILAGTSKSEMIAIQGQAMVGIVVPAAWTTALIGYEAGWDGNQNDTYIVYDGGGNPQTTVVEAVSSFIAFPSVNAIFLPFMKITSVAVADGVTPELQSETRELIVVFRKLFS